VTAMINCLISFILFLLLTGCLGAQGEKLTPHEQSALKAQLHGTRLLQSGELEAARINLLNAYKMYAAVEHRIGSSATLINLASLERRSGNYSEAELYLSQAKNLSVTSHKGQLAYEQALLELSTNNLARAEFFARESMKADPSLKGEAHNVIARRHFAAQDYNTALNHLDQALSNLTDGNLQERANAYRLSGKISQLQEKADAGKSFLEMALKLDQQLNKADKIALDLRLLAVSHRSLDDWKEELNYLRRLCLVEMNSGHLGKGSATLELIATRLEVHGLKEQAKELRSNVHTFTELGVVPIFW